MQTHHERHENTQLRTENEKLRADNMRYREALSNATCPNCGGPTAIGEMSFDEHHLRLENARLREEVNHSSLCFLFTTASIFTQHVYIRIYCVMCNISFLSIKILFSNTFYSLILKEMQEDGWMLVQPSILNILFCFLSKCFNIFKF